MARALVADPSTKTLSVSLTGTPTGAVTLRVRRKGHPGHHHATDTFGPLTGCHRLPSVRVFDHCGPMSDCCDHRPHVTPSCSGRVDVPECVTCCEHGHHDAHGGDHHHHGHHHGHHHHHHDEPSVTYTGTMAGCTAVFTLDENIHDAPAGFYLADVFDGAVKVKTMDLVLRGTGLRAVATSQAKGC